MSRLKFDYSGQTIGRLKVVRWEKNPQSGINEWFCECECGNHIYAQTHDLKTERVRSCGCLKKDLLSAKKKHGKCNTRLYTAYSNMYARCYNPKNHHYKWYGEKGITICDEWLGDRGRTNFIRWSEENGYADNLTIDRIDNNKPYSPSNCRWVTNKENTNNRSSNHIIEINGERKNISQWGEVYGISPLTISRRLRLGWDEVDAVIKPICRKGEKYGN